MMSILDVLRIGVTITLFLVLLCAFDKGEGPVDSGVGVKEIVEPAVQSAPSNNEGFFTLSLEGGPIENDEFGVLLIAVGPNFATVLSTKYKTFDTASVGGYFDGGSFGRIGLRLVRTDPATKSAFMRRNILH